METIQASWEKRLALKVKHKVSIKNLASLGFVEYFFTNEGDPNIAIVLFIGFPESRLPSFTKEDSEEIVGSFDFIGINFYTADIVFTKESDPNVVSYYADQDVSSYKVDIYNWWEKF